MGGLKPLIPLNLSFFGGGGGGGGFQSGRRQGRRQRGETPIDPWRQNREFRDAVNQLRREGFNLDERQIRRLHDEISGQGLDFWGIVEEGRSLFR